MGIFNPLMLDASIRDVVSSLPLDKKVDVLLYSLQHLPANSRSVTDLAYHSQPPVHIDDHSTAAAALSIVEFRSRTIIENAVQSCLQTVPIHQENVIRARLIRAKARFAAGLRGAAHQGERSLIDGSRNGHPIQKHHSQIFSRSSFSIPITPRPDSYCHRWATGLTRLERCALPRLLVNTNLTSLYRGMAAPTSVHTSLPNCGGRLLSTSLAETFVASSLSLIHCQQSPVTYSFENSTFNLAPLGTLS